MGSITDRITPKTLAIVAGALTVILLIFGAFALGQNQRTNQTPEPSVSEPQATEEPSVAPEPSPAIPSPTPTEEPVSYSDCAAVWEALGRPITSADPGYPAEQPNILDLDSDGIGCEDNPLTGEDESQIDWASIWEKTKGNAEDFGDWVAPQLKELWGIVSPSVNETWGQLKDMWKGAAQ